MATSRPISQKWAHCHRNIDTSGVIDSPIDPSPDPFMEKVAETGVDIAGDHETESYPHRTGEQIDRQEIEGHDQYPVRYRLYHRSATCDGSRHHVLLSCRRRRIGSSTVSLTHCGLLPGRPCVPGANGISVRKSR